MTSLPTSITALSAQSAKLSGDLSMHSVAALLPQGLALLHKAQNVWTIDMSEVQQVSSGAVALLLEWLKAAEASGKKLELQGLPEHMQAIIAISELEPLFAPLFRPAE